MARSFGCEGGAVVCVTALQQCAAQAGVSRALISWLFASSFALLASVLQDASSRFCSSRQNHGL